VTGFLQRLALRSAGLPAAGAPSLRLRPRALFEPSSHAATGPEMLDLEAPAATAAARGRSPAIGAAGPQPPSPDASPAAASVVARPPAPPAASVTPEPAPAAGRATPRLEETGARAAPPAAAAALAPTPADEGPEARVTWDPPGAPPRPAPPAPPFVADPGPPPPPPQRAAVPETVFEPVAAFPEPADTAAPFTLSIGRIDVEFISPPPPPARAPRAADSRSRGFAPYARMRRGSPR
jgi:hypothetical protein